MAGAREILALFSRTVAKRTRRGLYAGKNVLSGNNISDDGGNKTRRKWKPNAQKSSLYSDILGTTLQIRVTAAALRNIDKAGGLDNYILKTPDKHLNSDFAIGLKVKMLEKMVGQSLPASSAAGLGSNFGSTNTDAQR